MARLAGRDDGTVRPAAGAVPGPVPVLAIFPGRPGVRYRLVQGAGRPGEALWDVLDAAVRQRGIEVRFGPEAQHLDLDAGGASPGLRVTQAGRRSHPPPPRGGGVVLATGGFEGSAALTDAYLPRARSARWGIPATAARDCA